MCTRRIWTTFLNRGFQETHFFILGSINNLNYLSGYKVQCLADIIAYHIQLTPK